MNPLQATQTWANKRWQEAFNVAPRLAHFAATFVSASKQKQRVLGVSSRLRACVVNVSVNAILREQARPQLRYSPVC